MDPFLATMTSATLSIAGIIVVLSERLTLYPNLSI